MIFIRKQEGEERIKTYFAFLPVRVNDRATVWFETYFEIQKYDAKETKWKPYKRGFTRNQHSFFLDTWDNNIHYYGRTKPCAPSFSLWYSLQQRLKDVVSSLSALRH